MQCNTFRRRPSSRHQLEAVLSTYGQAYSVGLALSAHSLGTSEKVLLVTMMEAGSGPLYQWQGLGKEDFLGSGEGPHGARCSDFLSIRRPHLAGDHERAGVVIQRVSAGRCEQRPE
jgi:hypothetical protein